MAGWLSILQKLPWSEVIVNAPAVAQGAKKLWGSVAGRPAEAPMPPPEPAAPAEAAAPAEPMAALKDLQRLDARVGAVEATSSELHRQMLASTELLNALAEQNTQLVARVEALRVRLGWTLAAALALGVVAVAALVLPLLR
jgi:hypothetical protein